MMYAEISEGVVARTRPRPDWYEDNGVPVSDELLAQQGILPVVQTSPAHDEQRYALVVRAPEEWMVGLTSAQVTWNIVERRIEDRKALMLDALADRRWRAETGGGILSGVPIKTDRDSTAKITAAYVQAVANPSFTVRWKVDTGVFITLDAATIIAIGDAVTAHVQACFDNEDALTTAILAAEDHNALDLVDIHSGWPAV